MKYIISTDFNLRIYEPRGIINKNTLKPIDPNKWFLERLQIFQAFTLQSVLKQTYQNFTWFIHIDGNTPPSHYSALSNSLPNKKNIILSRGTTLDTLHKLLKYRTDMVLLQVLDSDDMDERDFIQRVQETAESISSKQQYIIDSSSLLRIDPGLSQFQFIDTTARKFFNPKYITPCYVLVTPCECDEVRQYVLHSEAATQFPYRRITIDRVHCQVMHQLNWFLAFDEVTYEACRCITMNDYVKTLIRQKYGVPHDTTIQSLQ